MNMHATSVLEQPTCVPMDTLPACSSFNVLSQRPLHHLLQHIILPNLFSQWNIHLGYYEAIAHVLSDLRPVDPQMVHTLRASPSRCILLNFVELNLFVANDVVLALSGKQTDNTTIRRTHKAFMDHILFLDSPTLMRLHLQNNHELYWVKWYFTNTTMVTCPPHSIELLSTQLWKLTSEGMAPSIIAYCTHSHIGLLEPLLMEREQMRDAYLYGCALSGNAETLQKGLVKYCSYNDPIDTCMKNIRGWSTRRPCRFDQDKFTRCTIIALCGCIRISSPRMANVVKQHDTVLYMKVLRKHVYSFVAIAARDRAWAMMCWFVDHMAMDLRMFSSSQEALSTIRPLFNDPECRALYEDTSSWDILHSASAQRLLHEFSPDELCRMANSLADTERKRLFARLAVASPYCLV